MYEIVVAVLCSTALAAIVNQVGNALQWRRQREAAKSDNKDDRLVRMERGMRSIMLDRIQHLCKAYIHDGAVDADDLRRLHCMHDNYHDLGGNGDLDTLMARVEELPIK